MCVEWIVFLVWIFFALFSFGLAWGIQGEMTHEQASSAFITCFFWPLSWIAWLGIYLGKFVAMRRVLKKG